MEKIPVIKNNYQEDIIKIDNFKIKDKLEFKIKECSISFDYSYPNIEVLFKSILDKPGYVASTKNGILNIIKNLRKIDSLSFENDKSKYSVFDILPEDWTILFPVNKNGKFKSCINFNDKTIMLNMNPLTKEGFMFLAHEIGHFEDERKISQFESYQKARSSFKIASGHGTEEDKNIIIKEERNAWANGLNHIRNFTGDLGISIEEINQQIHEDCLKSYEDQITELLNKN